MKDVKDKYEGSFLDGEKKEAGQSKRKNSN